MEDDLVAWGRVLRIETPGRVTGRPARAVVGFVEREDGAPGRRRRLPRRLLGPQPAPRARLPGDDRRRHLGRRGPPARRRRARRGRARPDPALRDPGRGAGRRALVRAPPHARRDRSGAPAPGDGPSGRTIRPRAGCLDSGHAYRAARRSRRGDQVPRPDLRPVAAATPSVLLDALVARAPELRDVGVIHLHTEGPGPHLAPEMAPHFRHRALFIGPNARKAVNEGRADFVPVFFSDVPALFSSGAYPLDAVFVNVTPPDAHGFCSLGLSVEAMHAAIAAAKTVIVQFNPSIPRTLGRVVHPREPDRPGDRGRPAAVRVPAPDDRRRRAADRRLRRRPHPGRRHAPARDRRDPDRRRRAALRQEGPRHPHRDVHGRDRGPRRGGRRHRRAQGAQPGQARRDVPDGDVASCTSSSTTTRWSRCGRSTSRTTPT